MDQRHRYRRIAARRRVSGIRHAQPGTGERDRGAADPGEPVTPGVDEHLADERPERDAEVERQRVEADGLARPALGREVGDGGEAGDEEERLGHAQQEPQDDEHREVIDEDMGREQHRAQERTTDQQRSTPDPVRQGSRRTAGGRAR